MRDRSSDIAVLEGEPRYKPAIHNGYWPNDIVTNGLVLNLPLHRYSGSRFKSVDPYQHLFTKTGALWTPDGDLLDGIDDKIESLNVAVLNITTAITVEVYLNPDAVNPANYGRYLDFIDDAGPGGSFHSYALGMEGTDETNVRWDLTGVSVLNSGLGAVTPGVLNHIAGAYDKNAGANNNKIIVNGVQVASETQIASITSKPNGVLRIGGHTGGGQYWKGLFCLARIYNRALTIQEVRHNRDVTRWRYGV